MTPFSGKLVWVLLISGGLFIAGSILLHYGMEGGAWLFLLFVGLGQVGVAVFKRKHNRDKQLRVSGRGSLLDASHDPWECRHCHGKNRASGQSCTWCGYSRLS